MERRTACEILDLDPLFGPDELKTAYRRAVKRYHPDNGLEPNELMLGKVNEAHQRLKLEAKEFAEVMGKASRKRESAFQSEVISAVEACGGVCINFVGHVMQGSGIPDLYLSHPIWIGYCELKVYDNNLEDLQRRRMFKLNRTGTPAVCVRYDGKGVSAEWEKKVLWYGSWKGSGLERGKELLYGLREATIKMVKDKNCLSQHIWYANS